MTRKELIAIQHLPARFLRNGTQVATYQQFVVAIHPKLTPIKWDGKQWSKINFASLKDLEPK